MRAHQAFFPAQTPGAPRRRLFFSVVSAFLVVEQALKLEWLSQENRIGLCAATGRKALSVETIRTQIHADCAR